jgi:hypothetical protein
VGAVETGQGRERGKGKRGSEQGKAKMDQSAGKSRIRHMEYWPDTRQRRSVQHGCQGAWPQEPWGGVSNLLSQREGPPTLPTDVKRVREEMTIGVADPLPLPEQKSRVPSRSCQSSGRGAGSRSSSHSFKSIFSPRSVSATCRIAAANPPSRPPLVTLLDSCRHISPCCSPR